MRTPTDTSGKGSTNGASGGSSWRSGASRGSGGDDVLLRWFDDSVCVFWLGDACYGLSSRLVGEVFAVESWVPVPASPPAVVGLFNLRGTPVALVDLAQVLELPAAAAEAPASGRLLALVLRTGSLLVGARIRKMEVVVPAGRGLYHPPDASAGEHPVVAGFLELPERPELTITLLDPEELEARLDRLRYRSSDEDDGE